MLCWNILDLGIHLHADKIPITVERVILHHHFFPIPSRTTCQRHMVKNCRNSLRNTRAKGAAFTYLHEQPRERQSLSRETPPRKTLHPWDKLKHSHFAKTRSQASILVYFYFYFHHCPSQTNMTFRGAHGFTLQHCPSCEVSSAKCALEISKNKQMRRNCSAGKKTTTMSRLGLLQKLILIY